MITYDVKMTTDILQIGLNPDHARWAKSWCKLWWYFCNIVPVYFEKKSTDEKNMKN